MLDGAESVGSPRQSVHRTWDWGEESYTEKILEICRGFPLNIQQSTDNVYEETT